MSKIHLAPCKIPEFAPKKTKDAAAKINAKLSELAAIGKDNSQKRDALLADALEGKVSGQDFLRRRKELREAEAQIMVDVEIVAMYLAKRAICSEITEAGNKEAARLNGLGDEREKALAAKLEGFQARQAEKTALIRGDQALRGLREAAKLASGEGGQFLAQSDHEVMRCAEMQIRAALGVLPAR